MRVVDLKRGEREDFSVGERRRRRRLRARASHASSSYSARSRVSSAPESWSGAVEGSFAGELAEQLKSLSVDIASKQGTTHSNDEGLF